MSCPIGCLSFLESWATSPSHWEGLKREGFHLTFAFGSYPNLSSDLWSLILFSESKLPVWRSLSFEVLFVPRVLVRKGG